MGFHPLLFEAPPPSPPVAAEPVIHIVAPPPLVRAPTRQELRLAYPADAFSMRRPGEAVLLCHVGQGGALTGCRVSEEAPAGHGFGQAALKLAVRYRLAPATDDGRPIAGGQARIPVRFTPDDAQYDSGTR